MLQAGAARKAGIKPQRPGAHPSAQEHFHGGIRAMFSHLVLKMTFALALCVSSRPLPAAQAQLSADPGLLCAGAVLSGTLVGASPSLRFSMLWGRPSEAAGEPARSSGAFVLAAAHEAPTLSIRYIL
jgi:hypothetical protein